MTPKATADRQERLITVQEAAKRLCCHPKTIKKNKGRWRARGLVILTLGPTTVRVQESSVNACIREMVRQHRQKLGMEAAT